MRLFDCYGHELSVGDLVAYEGRKAKIDAMSAPGGRNPQGLVTISFDDELRPLNILPSEINAAFKARSDF